MVHHSEVQGFVSFLTLKVSHIQPVPDVRVWLLLLSLLHLEPHPLQPDELQVQEGLQGRPPLRPPAKSKGELPNQVAMFCTCYVTDDLCDEHEQDPIADEELF